MELLYIWIENYKNIKKQGFNLSSRWRFDYDPETGQVKVDKREETFKDFFNKDIINVTAIVGKNGSGKTSLLDYLCSNIEDGLSLSYWNAKMMLIYSDKEANIIVLHHNDLVKPAYKGTIPLQLISFPKSSNETFLPLIQMKFIHYSDVFDAVKPDSRSWDLTTSFFNKQSKGRLLF